MKGRQSRLRAFGNCSLIWPLSQTHHSANNIDHSCFNNVTNSDAHNGNCCRNYYSNYLIFVWTNTFYKPYAQSANFWIQLMYKLPSSRKQLMYKLPSSRKQLMYKLPSSRKHLMYKLPSSRKHLMYKLLSSRKQLMYKLPNSGKY